MTHVHEEEEHLAPWFKNSIFHINPIKRVVKLISAQNKGNIYIRTFKIDKNMISKFCYIYIYKKKDLKENVYANLLY